MVILFDFYFLDQVLTRRVWCLYWTINRSTFKNGFSLIIYLNRLFMDDILGLLGNFLVGAMIRGCFMFNGNNILRLFFFNFDWFFMVINNWLLLLNQRSGFLYLFFQLCLFGLVVIDQKGR